MIRWSQDSPQKAVLEIFAWAARQLEVSGRPNRSIDVPVQPSGLPPLVSGRLKGMTLLFNR